MHLVVQIADAFWPDRTELNAQVSHFCQRETHKVVGPVRVEGSAKDDPFLKEEALHIVVGGWAVDKGFGSARHDIDPKGDTSARKHLHWQ